MIFWNYIININICVCVFLNDLWNLNLENYLIIIYFLKVFSPKLQNIQITLYNTWEIRCGDWYSNRVRKRIHNSWANFL